MRGESPRVSLILREPVSAAKRDEVLMATQFPDDFFVAGRARINLVYAAPVQERRPLA